MLIVGFGMEWNGPGPCTAPHLPQGHVDAVLRGGQRRLPDQLRHPSRETAAEFIGERSVPCQKCTCMRIRAARHPKQCHPGNMMCWDEISPGTGNETCTGEMVEI